MAYGHGHEAPASPFSLPVMPPGPAQGATERDCEPPPARLRIVSDGHGLNTRLSVVHADGTEAPLSDLVTVLSVSFDATSYAKVTLEVGDLDLDVQAAVIAVTEQPKAAVPEMAQLHGREKDGTSVAFVPGAKQPMISKRPPAPPPRR